MSFSRARGFLVVAVVALVLVVPAGGRATIVSDIVSAPCSVYDPLLCPKPVPGGASCIAHGVLVRERDLTGTGLVGDVVVDLSRSDAWIGTPVEPQRPPGPQPHLPPEIQIPPLPEPDPVALPPDLEDGDDLQPPTSGDPFAHGDAQQAGASYSSVLASLSTSNVYSRCDVAQVEAGGSKVFQAYGRGGVHDLSLVALVGTLAVSTRLLDFEVLASSGPPAGASYDCDLLNASVTPPTPPLSILLCPPPNTAAGVSPYVTAMLNEQWGSVPNIAGQAQFGGAMVHVTVLVPGVSQVDVWIGYAAVAVPGGVTAPGV